MYSQPRRGAPAAPVAWGASPPAVACRAVAKPVAKPVARARARARAASGDKIQLCPHRKIRFDASGEFVLVAGIRFFYAPIKSFCLTDLNMREAEYSENPIF